MSNHSTTKSNASTAVAEVDRPEPLEQAHQLVQDLFGRLGPTVVEPDALQRLLTVSPSDLESVVATVKRSPSIAARILSVANSAALGVANEITSVERAVVLIGPKRTRTVAMAHGLRLMTNRLDLPERTLSLLWSANLQRACAAQMFCEAYSPDDGPTAYALGLLCDIGLPILMAQDPDFYGGGLRKDADAASWLSQECAHFGFDHATVGTALLAQWGVIDSLRLGVMQHHLPPLAEELEARDRWTILRLAVFLSGLMPHLTEPLDDGAKEWVRAIHAPFLLPTYPTFEDFLRAIAPRVQELVGIVGGAAPTPIDERMLQQQLINELAGDNLEMVANICRLEHALSNEQQGAQELRSKAFTDPLTKLLNRRGFITLTQRRLASAGDQRLGVCCALIDGDDFKSVNDTYGHAVGDQVLRGIAKLLRTAMPKQTILARLGGDEFAVLAVGLDEAQARAFADSLATSLEGAKLRVAHDVTLTLHVSIGCAFYDAWGEKALSQDALLHAADVAMYERKKNGKHGVSFTVVLAEGVEAEPSVTQISSRGPLPQPHAREAAR